MPPQIFVTNTGSKPQFPGLMKRHPVIGYLYDLNNRWPDKPHDFSDSDRWLAPSHLCHLLR